MSRAKEYDVRVSVAWTSEQLAELDKAAAYHGLERATFIRLAALLVARSGVKIGRG